MTNKYFMFTLLIIAGIFTIFSVVGALGCILMGWDFLLNLHF